MWMLACLLVLSASLSLCEGSDNIIYKRVDTYDWVYDNVKTGSRRHFSVWRPRDYESGYYALGDTAVGGSRAAPQTSAVVVRDVGDSNLRKPLKFVEMWNDRGSGGKHDVRVMRMVPPSGFKCLGHVAVIGYDNTPDRNLFRCVRMSMLVFGSFQKIWDDRGSGSNTDSSFYGVVQSPDLSDGLDANTFKCTPSYDLPNGDPNMISFAFATNRANIQLEMDNLALTVYQTTDLKEIWNDRKSGSKDDLSTWRSEGPTDTYSLGDIAVQEYSQPDAGFVVKALKDDVLKPALSWRQVWNDRGSGARWDGSIWQPSCPYMYRALGYVTMRNYDETPPANAFRCVKSEYTVEGTWDLVWKDIKSGAKVDVGIWKAIPTSNGQGLSAMMAVANHDDMERTAFVLDPTIVNYVIGKPAVEYTLSNVQYNFDDRSIAFAEPETLIRTIMENRGDSEQTMTRKITYSYTESVSWGASSSLAVGVTTKVTAGVPAVASSEVSLSTTMTVSQNWGESTSETKTDATSVTITVQPNSQKAAVLTGKRYQMDIPYTATLVTTYADGSTGRNEHFSGVFMGVNVNEVRVIYEEDVPLN